MKNINKNSTSSGFKLLSVIAFALLFVPMSANAGYNYVFGSPDGINYNYGNYNPTNYTYNPPAPTYVPPPAPVTPPTYNPPTIYSGTPVATNSSTTKKTTTTTVAKANTNTKVSTEYMLVPVANIDPVNVATVDTNYRNPNLAASVILGENSFAPSGILQWILLAILILIIVILARRIFGGTQKYMKVPLKHA